MTIVYVMGLFIQILDATIVNVALPALAREFEVSVDSVEWVVLSYVLAVAVIIPTAGWFGDRFGTKRVFLGALIAFTIASAACGAARSLDQLIAARALQGMAAGMITPIGSALLFRAYPMAERARAASYVVSVAVIAPAVGPVLGGILVDGASWRWIFLVNLPIGTLATLLGIAWLSGTDDNEAGPFDAAGFFLAGAGLACSLLGLSLAPDRGMTDPLVLGTLGLGVVLLVAMVKVELGLEQPILALRLLGDRLFRQMNIVTLFTFGGFIGHVYLFSIYLQDFRGTSAKLTGLTQAPQAVGVFIISSLLGRTLYRKFGPRRLLTLGVGVTGLSTGAFVASSAATPLVVFGTLMLIRGLAMGLVFVSIQTAVYSNISNADTARATSLFNSNRQAAGAIGVAAAAAIVAAVGPDAASTGAEITSERLLAYRSAFGALALLFVPAVVFAFGVVDQDAAGTR